ncbi:MAG TPA: hypothetical protein VK013_17240 [Myxococcaceae bacterium]|nr:hypothetical protein [Myxococcaceae bacterium]
MIKLQNLKAALQKVAASAPPAPKKAQPAPAGHQGTSSFAPATPMPTALPWDPAAMAKRAANVLRNATTSTVTAPDLSADEEAQVDAAAEKVEQAYQQGGPEAASIELRQQAEELGSPHLVDALLLETETTVDAITADLARRAAENEDDGDLRAPTFEGAFALTAVYELAGDEGRELVVSSLGDALAVYGEIDLNQLDDRLLDASRGGTPGLTGALSQYLLDVHGLEVMARTFQDISIAGVGAATEAYESAQAEKAALEQRLAEDLAILGPGMTEAEQAAYEEAFWADPEHAAVAKREAEAAERLSEVMEAQGPELEARARAGDPEASKLLMKGWETLAKSPAHAEAAIEWSGRLACDPELFNAMNGALGGELESRLRDGLLCDAIPLAQASLLNANPDDPSVAIEALRALLGPLQTAEVFSDLSGEIGKLFDALDIIGRIDRATPGELQWAADLLRDFSGGFGNVLKGTVAVFGLVSGVAHFGEGEWPEGVINLLESVEAGYDLLGGTLKTLSWLDDALATRVLPSIGLILDAAQLKEDIELLRKNGTTPGEVFALFGTGVSLLGNVLRFVPPAMGAGAIMTVIGDVIHELGIMFSGQTAQARAARREERDAFLEAAGISAERREQLLLNPWLNVQAGALGITGPHLDALHELQAECYEDPVRSQAFHQATHMAAVLGLEGEDALVFIEQVMELDEEALFQLNAAIILPAMAGGTPESVVEDQQRGAKSFIRQHFPSGVLDADGNPVDLDAIEPEDANLPYFDAWPAME